MCENPCGCYVSCAQLRSWWKRVVDFGERFRRFFSRIRITDWYVFCCTLSQRRLVPVSFLLHSFHSLFFPDASHGCRMKVEARKKSWLICGPLNEMLSRSFKTFSPYPLAPPAYSREHTDMHFSSSSSSSSHFVSAPLYSVVSSIQHQHGRDEVKCRLSAISVNLRGRFVQKPRCWENAAEDKWKFFLNKRQEQGQLGIKGKKRKRTPEMTQKNGPKRLKRYQADMNNRALNKWRFPRREREGGRK